MRRAAAVTLIATGAVLAVTLTATNEPEPKQPPTAKQVVGYINHQRSVRGLSTLRWSFLLAAASKRHSARLSRLGTLTHATRLLLPGLKWAGETLYRGSGGPVRPWLLSPPHRAILLSRRARLVGMARSGDTWVGRFGAR